MLWRAWWGDDGKVCLLEPVIKEEIEGLSFDPKRKLI